MAHPPYLQKGDKIGIAATAKKVSPEEMSGAIELLQTWGLEVVESSTLYASFNQFAGSDNERIAGLQELLDDPDIRAIICARGGYGTVRIIDKLDFTEFYRSPKWIAGFSDVTVLHSHIQHQFQIPTLHSPMAYHLSLDCSEEAKESFRRSLFGEEQNYSTPANDLNIHGVAEGLITGGNLSILYSLTGTNSLPDMKGKILFIEDLDEYLYHVDRMMMNLKRAGLLKDLAGLVVGGMTKMNDNLVPFGKSAEEIILEHVGDYGYPVCFDFPSGHITGNLTLTLGQEVTLEISGKGTSLFTK